MPGDALEVIATLVIVIAWALRAILSPLAKRQEEKRRQQEAGQRQQSAPAASPGGREPRRQGPQRTRSSAGRQSARSQPRPRPQPAPATLEAGEPIQPAPPPQPSVSSREKAPERPLPAHEGTRSLTGELLRELGMEIEQPGTGTGTGTGTGRGAQGVPGEQLIASSGDLEVVELGAPPPLIGEEPAAGDIQAPRLEVLAPGAGPKGSSVSLAQEIRQQLYGGPRSLGQAVLLAEILGPAPGLRPPGLQTPGENQS